MVGSPVASSRPAPHSVTTSDPAGSTGLAWNSGGSRCSIPPAPSGRARTTVSVHAYQGTVKTEAAGAEHTGDLGEARGSSTCSKTS